jgi:hypothetical protein
MMKKYTFSSPFTTTSLGNQKFINNWQLTLVNGHVTYSNISRVYNSVATYSCDQGYELHGVRYRYCQSVNGTSQFEWTGIAPLCRGK